MPPAPAKPPSKPPPDRSRLRTGFTTGACAAAAAKAATRCLLRGSVLSEITTTLPNRDRVTFAMMLGVPLMLAYDSTVVKTVNEAHALHPEAVNQLATDGGNTLVRAVVIVGTLAVLVWAMWQSKRTTTLDSSGPADPDDTAVIDTAVMAK
jgi:hypothetical protein